MPTNNPHKLLPTCNTESTALPVVTVTSNLSESMENITTAPGTNNTVSGAIIDNWVHVSVDPYEGHLNIWAGHLLTRSTGGKLNAVYSDTGGLLAAVPKCRKALKIRHSFRHF